jgi:hypothetical protein
MVLVGDARSYSVDIGVCCGKRASFHMLSTCGFIKQIGRLFWLGAEGENSETKSTINTLRR